MPRSPAAIVRRSAADVKTSDGVADARRAAVSWWTASDQNASRPKFGMAAALTTLHKGPVGNRAAGTPTGAPGPGEPGREGPMPDEERIRRCTCLLTPA